MSSDNQFTALGPAVIGFQTNGGAQAMLRYAAQALDLAAKSGAQAQIAESHQCTARAQLLLGRLDEAAALAFSAAKTYNAIGDIDGYGHPLHSPCAGTSACWSAWCRRFPAS
jgi:hypothetical protein